jgi:hypothetical protein
MYPSPDYDDFTEEELFDVYEKIDRNAYPDRFDKIQSCLYKIAVNYYKNLSTEEAIRCYFTSHNYRPSDVGVWESCDYSSDGDCGGDGGDGGD